MKRQPAAPEISDRAVIRWLERVYNLDLSAVREHLAGKAMTGAEYGATAVRIDGLKLLLAKDGEVANGDPYVVMTTVIKKGVEARRKIYRRAS